MRNRKASFHRGHTALKILFILIGAWFSFALAGCGDPTTTIGVSPAAALAFTAPPSTTAMAGVNLTTAPVVSIEDSNGNVVAAATNTVALAAYTDSACTVAAGGTLSVATNPVAASSGMAAFAGVQESLAQTLYIGAASAGLTSACSGAITITPGPSLSQSVVSVATGTNASGNPDLLTLTTKDASGNPLTTGGLTVVFSNTGGTSTGNFGATTDHANGTYTATFTGVLTGSATSIGAKIGGTAVTSASPTITVTPGAVSLAQSTVAVASGTDASATTDLLTLTAKDAAGNQLSAGGLTVLFSNTGGTSTGTFCGSVTDNSNGTYTCGFTGVISGTATTLHATIGGGSVTSAAPTITVTPGAVSLAQSVVTVAGGLAVSGGTDLLTLTAKDAAGNLETTGGLTVLFSNTGGTSTGTFCGSVTDNSNGTYACGFTGGTAGTATGVHATIGGGSVTSAAPTIQVIPAVQIAANNYGDHTCAVSSSGNVYCWGLNSNGQLGNNSTTNQTTPVEVTGVGGSGNIAGIVSLAAGSAHTCALSSSGNVYCWGQNTYGALGDNTYTGPQTCSSNACSQTPVEVEGVGASGFLTGIVSLTAGAFHTCALSSSGNVYCWGSPSWGQLGNNSTSTEALTPVEVEGVGGAGYLSGITGLTAGSSHTCAASSTGNVYCWGYNATGQLGNNTTTEQNTPVEVVAVGGSGNLSGIASVTAGYSHTCAVNSSGNIYCWGLNSTGQLGDNSSTGPQTCSGSSPCSEAPIEVEGVGATGYLSGIVSLSAGVYHTCALNSAGNVYCWGNTNDGQVGNNTTSQVDTPVEVEGVGGSGFLSSISAVAAGSYYSCALNSSGNVYCWGQNTDGQLGNNSTTQENVPVEVEGVGGTGFLSGI